MIIYYDLAQQRRCDAGGAVIAAKATLAYMSAPTWELNLMNGNAAIDVSDATAWRVAVDKDYDHKTEPMLRASGMAIDFSGAAQGRLRIVLDTNTATYKAAVDGKASLPAWFEVWGATAEGVLRYYLVMPITAAGAVDPLDGDPPEPASLWADKLFVTAIAAGKTETQLTPDGGITTYSYVDATEAQRNAATAYRTRNAAIPNAQWGDWMPLLRGADGRNGTNGRNGTDGTDGRNGLDGIDGHDGVDGTTPHIGENGNWWIGNKDTGVTAGGQIGVTPRVGENGNWWVGDTDTGAKAGGRDGVDGADGRNGTDGRDGVDGSDGANGIDGRDGVDGTTPHIGENGNWWIGDVDTGVAAGGNVAPSAQTAVLNVPLVPPIMPTGFQADSLRLQVEYSLLPDMSGSAVLDSIVAEDAARMHVFNSETFAAIDAAAGIPLYLANCEAKIHLGEWTEVHYVRWRVAVVGVPEGGAQLFVPAPYWSGWGGLAMLHDGHGSAPIIPTVTPTESTAALPDGAVEVGIVARGIVIAGLTGEYAQYNGTYDATFDVDSDGLQIIEKTNGIEGSWDPKYQYGVTATWIKRGGGGALSRGFLFGEAEGHITQEGPYYYLEYPNGPHFGAIGASDPVSSYAAAKPQDGPWAGVFAGATITYEEV